MRFNLDNLLERANAGENGCMELPASSKIGYAQLWDGNKVVYAHRVVAELAHGKPDEGRWAIHSCDNRKCINPQHLRWGTPKDNSEDAVSRGRLIGRNHVRGDAHPSTPLTANDVRTIRKLRLGGAIYKEIAKSYGISLQAVAAICTNKTWKEVA
jgi:hypothetical protein